MHFEGISGAINVSIVAFSIVFGVLLILTAVIYAMKVFAGGEDKPGQAKPAGGVAAKPAAKAAPAVSVAAPAVASQAKIVAAITAAILAMTGGRGKILSIVPAAGACASGPFSTWRASGIMNLVNGRLNRTWNQR